MACQIVYMVAAGLMAIIAAVPFAESHGPQFLGFLACAWVVGTFFVPVHLSELLSDHFRTALGVFGFSIALALLVPAMAVVALFALLLVIRQREFFGMLALMSLLALAVGLPDAPSYGPPALVLVCMVAAAHARVARALRAQTLAAAGLMLGASLCAGAALAFLAPFGLPASGSSLETSRPPSPDSSHTPLVIALLVLPVVGFLLVKHLHFLNRSPRGKGKDGMRTEGRLEKDEAMLAQEGASFSGSRTNAAVVKGYLRWRTQLASLGFRFVREDTAEEGASLMASAMAGNEELCLRRITEIFNLARYGAEEVSEADAGEFAALTKSLAKECARQRR